MKNIVFVGGGTGGHIYPGLAVADELRKILDENGIKRSDYRIIWIGSRNRLDADIVQKSGSADRFVGIPCGKLRRYFSFRNFLDVFKIAAGFISSFFLMIKYKPLMVFSKGGFVSVPPCYAAKALNIPVFTHECDFSPGLATRLNSKCASKILVSFEDTKKFFKGQKAENVVLTGNPVRPVFYETEPEKGLNFLGISVEEKTEKPLLLVLGGSLGSRQINELIRDNLDWLTERYIVVHQTGKQNIGEFQALREQYPEYRPYAFIYSEMPHVMAAADVVVSRAGSNFLWECAVTGKPLVLVPLSGSGTRGDQEENAAFFQQNGAAEVLAGENVNSEYFRKVLTSLESEDERRRLSENVRNMIGSKRPAYIIAGLIYDIIRGNF